MNYRYEWMSADIASASEDLLDELAILYSDHYGYWSAHATARAGGRIRLSPSRLRQWLTPQSVIAIARDERERIIGYAIAVQRDLSDLGKVSWVTQLVVHENHRQVDVGKTLLFSIWGFSDHFAWGLITANPYAVRALEKATRRRCSPERIKRNHRRLMNFGSEYVLYIAAETQLAVSVDSAKINTDFRLDHSGLDAMLGDVTSPEKPWVLGPLQDGWEWFAFTFKDQPQIKLTSKEINDMLTASDQIAKQAYSRMQVSKAHKWAKYTAPEARFIIETCGLAPGQSVLDLGCGMGRHCRELAKAGLQVTGVDFIEDHIDAARKLAVAEQVSSAKFICGDCRLVSLDAEFDAVLCLYDVIGSYCNDADNLMLLIEIELHLKAEGFALLSVMNMEMTEAKATQFFSLANDPSKLLSLQPSHTMEKSGDIFDPQYYLIDSDTGIVYRREQFSEGDKLPAELVVRDRRFRAEEIEAMCRTARLKVVWTRFVHAGHWDKSLDPRHESAKEILILCQKPA